MFREGMEAQLELKSIWEDDDLFEIRVYATNGRFTGEADCYTNRDHLLTLATDLRGFPKNTDQVVTFTTGENDNISFFSLLFKCTDAAGHIVLRVKITHIMKYTNSDKEHYTSEFDLSLEAAAIDDFITSLESLCKSSLGSLSKLKGKT